MKHLKKFNESIEEEPQIGDYAIAGTNSSNIPFKTFLNNTIGKIIFIDKVSVNIEYENIPDSIKDNFNIVQNNRTCDRSLLKYHSKYKEELEIILSQNKYNL